MKNFPPYSKRVRKYRHYDATKTAKLLVQHNDGIHYLGEVFSNNGGTVVFNKPILWFPSALKIGDTIDEERSFIKYNSDGSEENGTFCITQNITALEIVKVPAGRFTKCLKIDFYTYWDFKNGREAKSINTYHYAHKTGVVKASARFIVLMNNKELVNRLVTPNLKSFKLN